MRRAHRSSQGLSFQYHCYKRTGLVFFSSGGKRAAQGTKPNVPPPSNSPSLSSSESHLVSGPPLGDKVDIGNGSTWTSRRRRTEDPKRRSNDNNEFPAKYKTNRKPLPDIKVKRRAPWGMQQLRDSWSMDAMTKGDRENMSERIHREYRYHPDEFRRGHIKLTAYMMIPALLFGAFSSYYYHTGRPLWEGDPQFVLNIIRQLDTSPRSKLHAYKLEGSDELPLHVKAYREKKLGEEAPA